MLHTLFCLIASCIMIRSASSVDTGLDLVDEISKIQESTEFKQEMKDLEEQLDTARKASSRNETLIQALEITYDSTGVAYVKKLAADMMQHALDAKYRTGFEFGLEAAKMNAKKAKEEHSVALEAEKTKRDKAEKKLKEAQKMSGGTIAAIICASVAGTAAAVFGFLYFKQTQNCFALNSLV